MSLEVAREMSGSLKTALHDLLHRTRHDDELRTRLQSDPKGTLAAEAGIEVPEGVEVVVVEDTAEKAHLVLPPQGGDVAVAVELDEEDLGEASGAQIGMGMMGVGQFGDGVEGSGFQDGAGSYGFQGGHAGSAV